MYVTSCATNAHWERLCEVIGREDLKKDPRLVTPPQRGNHAAEINKRIETWTKNFTKFEAMRKLGAAGVPCGAVIDIWRRDRTGCTASRAAYWRPSGACEDTG